MALLFEEPSTYSEIKSSVALPPPEELSSVVTLTVLLLPEIFPAASFALTKKVYDVFADKPVTE